MIGDQHEYQNLRGNHRFWDLAQMLIAGRRYRVADICVLTDGGAIVAIFVAAAPGVG